MSHRAGPPAGDPAARPGDTTRYRARWRPLASLTESDWLAWSALAGRAARGNAFLAPWFVRPALRHLEPQANPDVLWIERDGTDSSASLAGLLLARGAAAPRRSLPRVHLEAWRGVHAFTGGALLDRDDADGVRRALLAALPAHPGEAGALRLSNLPVDEPCPLNDVPADLSGALRWFPTRLGARAALRTSGVERADTASFDEAVNADRGPDDVRRGRARLQREFGRLDLRVLRGPNLTETVIERHLALEAAGWKSAEGSAMLSSPATAKFFRECVAAARGVDAAVFCELWAGATPVASTSNFVCGEVLSAFKLGWEPRAARSSPGQLVDHALATVAARALPDVTLIDSCADPGSHLERLWPDRVTVADGYLAWGRTERALLGTLHAARTLRSRMRGRHPAG